MKDYSIFEFIHGHELEGKKWILII
jgi:hypothetical protein